MQATLDPAVEHPGAGTGSESVFENEVVSSG